MKPKLWLLVIVLALAGAVGVSAAPTTAAPATPVAPLATMAGTVSILSLDYRDGTSGTEFYLTGEDGLPVRLLPGRLAAHELAAYNLQPVVVFGQVGGPLSGPATDGQSPPFVVDQIEAAVPGEAAPAMIGPTNTIQGQTRWVGIGCKFSDRPAEEHSLDYFDAMYADTFPGLNHYWREVSNDHIWLDGSHAIGWYIMPEPYAGYVDGAGNFALWKFQEDCLAAADPDVYFPDYYGVNLIVNGDTLQLAWGTATTLTLDGVTRAWGVTWMTQWTHKWVCEFEHEIGHAYGLWHSYVNHQPGPYHNVWDVMSRDEFNCPPFSDPVYGCYGQHTIGRNKAHLGWIDPERIYVAGAATQTVTLERSALPPATGYLLVEIPVNGSPTHYYTLETRQLLSYDAKLPAAGVIIHEIGAPPYIFEIVSQSRDESGTSDHNVFWWSPGETFNAVEGGISVHIDAETPTGYVVTIRTGLRPATMTLAPTADTYIRRAAPATNYGRESVLLAEAQDAAGRINISAAVKFDGQQLPPTTFGLALRLHTLDDGGAAIPNNVFWSSPNYALTNTPWTETGLVWNNAYDTWPVPSIDPPVRDADVVAWDVLSALTNYGSPSFRVDGGDAQRTVHYSSRETANPPQLVVDYLVPPEPTTTTFLPTNDAYVSSAQKNAVFNKPRLLVRDAAADFNSYVKFNVTGLTGTVQSAVLRLWVVDPGPDGGRVYATSPYYKATTTQWLETGLKWNNAPLISGSPLAAIGPVTKGRWVAVDVTAAVAGNGRASFAISNDSATMIAYSSQTGAHPPELVVVTE